MGVTFLCYSFIWHATCLVYFFTKGVWYGTLSICFVKKITLEGFYFIYYLCYWSVDGLSPSTPPTPPYKYSPHLHSGHPWNVGNTHTTHSLLHTGTIISQGIHRRREELRTRTSTSSDPATETRKKTTSDKMLFEISYFVHGAKDKSTST